MFKVIKISLPISVFMHPVYFLPEQRLSVVSELNLLINVNLLMIDMKTVFNVTNRSFTMVDVMMAMLP